MLIETSVIKDDEILEAEVLSEIVNVGGGTGIPYVGEYSVTPSEVTQTLATADRYLNRDVVVNPIPSGYIVPEGVLSINANDTYDVTNYASAEVNIQPSLQSKSVTPSEEVQNVVADAEFDGLSEVTVEPIPSEYEIPDVYPYNLRIYPLKIVRTYPTANKKLLSDVVVEAVPTEQQTLTVTNPKLTYFVEPTQGKFLDEVKVNVAIPEETKTISITENGTTEVLPDEGKVLSGVTVEVDVQSGGTVGKPYVDSSQFRSLKEFFYMGNNPISILEHMDTSNVTNFGSAFYGTDIQSINSDTIVVDSGINFSNAFRSCKRLISVFGSFNNATNISFMLTDCGALVEVGVMNTAKCINFERCFVRCTSLHTIESLDLTSATNYSAMFANCNALANITFEGIVPIFNDAFNMASCPLTVESLTSLINALHNKDGATHTITLGASNIAKLTEAQLQSIADKNINIQ